MLDSALLITETLLGAGVLCAVVRVFRGPSVLDRVIALDVILLVVSSMLLVDMVARDHQDFLFFVIAGAMIGFLGSVAIARFVPVRLSEQAAAAPGDDGAARGAEPARPTSPPPSGDSSAAGSSAGGPSAGTSAGAAGDEDPATAWFSTLTRSGYVSRRTRGRPEVRGGAGDQQRDASAQDGEEER